jgi:TP901 family phage tail tape measure protein
MAEGIIKDSDVTGEDIYGLARKSLEKYITAIDSSNKDLAKQAELLDRITKSADTASKKGIDQLVVSRKKLEQVADKANKNDQQAIRTQKQLQKARLEELRLQKQREQAFDKFNKKEEIANKRQVRESIKNRKNTLKLNDAYKILSRQYNNAQKRLKRLTLQYGEHDKRTIKARKNLKNLEVAYRKVNKAAGDSRPFIGEYERSLGKLRTTLLRTASSLGLVGGGFAIFSKVKNTIVGFDQSMQNLSAITRDNTDALREQARELGGNTVFTASEAADAMTKLAMAGFDTNQILAATPATLALASAGQIELAEAADIASNVLSGFGLQAEETDRVVDVLAATATTTNTTVSSLGESFKEIAPTANNLNIPIEEVAAAIGLLGNSGIKGTDATTTLNSALNRLSKPTAEMKAKMSELNVEFFNSNGEFIGLTNTVDVLNKSFVGLTDEQKANAISTIFGARANKQMTSLLLGQTKAMVDGTEQTLKGSDALRELTKEYEEAEGRAQEMADVQEDSVAGSFKMLNSALEEYILGADEANGFSEKLKNTFKFLAKNIDTILGTLGSLLKLYLIYKTRIIVLNALNGKFGASLKNISAAFKKGETNGKRFTGALKSIGSALKGIGITAAIAAVWKLYEAWANVAFKTQQYENFLKRQEASETKQGEFAQKRSDARAKEFQDRVNEINILRSQRKISSEEAQRQIKELTDARKSQVDSDIKNVRKRKNEALAELEAVRKKRQSVFDAAADQFGIAAGKDAEDAVRKVAGTQSFGGGSLLDLVNEIDAEFNAASAKVAGLGAKLVIYKDESEGLTQSIVDQTIEINNNTNAQEGNGKAIEDNTESIEDQTEAYKNLKTEFDRQVESAAQVANKRSKELEKETQVVQDNLRKQLITINDFEKERALTSEEAAANRIAVELEALEKQRELLIKYGQDVRDIDLQISQKSLELAKATSADVVDVEKDENAQRLEARKELFDALEDLGEKEIDNFIKRSKRKQDALDEEINQIQSLEDAFRDSAKNQNALASESLAELESTKNEKIRQKQDEANKQAALEELKAAYAALNNFLDKGDDFASATAKSISGIKVFKDLVSSIASIPGFFKGTKNAPEGLAWTDEQGAEIHLDKHGNVKDWGSDGGARLKKLEQGDQILTPSESKTRQTEILNRQLSGAAMLQNVSMNKTSSTDQSLLLEMRKLRQTINDKPEYSLHPILKNGVLVGLNEQQRRGSKIENFKTLTRS